jgi:hypothetical protein
MRRGTRPTAGADAAPGERTIDRRSRLALVDGSSGASISARKDVDT